MTLRDAVRRANEALDWIEQRDGPLKPDGYARVEATVAEVRAWGQAMSDDERISEIRASHFGCQGQWQCDVAYLLARVDALTAERDEWKRINQSDNQCAARRLEQAESERDALAARLAASEAALTPCSLAREYRDGVTCRDYRDSRGVCMNHRVIEGLRVHAVTADRLEIENRALRRQVRATYGIIHEGLHGGKATDPEHQEACERPACRNARAALAERA